MYHQQSVTQVLKEFKTSETSGLSDQEAKSRLRKYGTNTLPTKPKPPIIFKLFSQFKNILVLILLAATILSLILGDLLDAIAIFTIVILNATIGGVQEIQAEKTLDSLKDTDVTFALVLRSGQIQKTPAAEITVGDILILEEGAKVPADARVIESYSLHVNESILTGESLPISKKTEKLDAREVALADRVNMVFKDTQITSGRGKAIVVAIGKETEMGKIALFLEEAKGAKSPLTAELDRVGQTLTAVVIFIAILVFILNLSEELTFVNSLLISVSLAVAAIPEGLPAVVSIVLALGVTRLAQKKTLVKKLPAVETLGAVRIIATDKTGTLTQNKISVVTIVTASNRKYFVEGEGYLPRGVFYDQKRRIVNPAKDKNLEKLFTAASLANNATLTGDSSILGDTTEAALLVSAARANIDNQQLQKTNPRIHEIPFSSERKMMSVIVKVDDTDDHFLYTKGAPEQILPRCNLRLVEQKKALVCAQQMSSTGLRTLAFAIRKIEKRELKMILENGKDPEANLTYLGIAGMEDPLRSEVKQAIAAAKLAGIRTIMITGDHKETAVSIAKQAGIITNGTLTENDLVKMTDEQLIHALKGDVNVFARIAPFTKLRIVDAIKKIPNTQVAVTGDGVNDAPALSSAHIGIAMGQTGTDVTREIADIVITDDNYATIVTAVEEGRIIYANLIKFIRYLISCNLSEVFVIAAGVAFGTPLPLLPIQILWINLITDGLPALALGVDPPEYDVMKKPPRDLSKGILHKKRLVYMSLEGAIMGVSVFLLFLYGLFYHSYQEAQTFTFSALALSQLVHAFNNRSTRKSLFTLGIFSNGYLVATAIISIFLQILVVQTNWGNLVFKTVSLDLYHWSIIALVSIIPFFVVEIKKQLRFRILP